MKFAAISNCEKVWEVIFASACLEGAEREEALRRLQVETEPVNG